MHAVLSLCALLSCFCSITFAADVPLPSEDPFYVQPQNISEYQPGDIIDSRIVSDDLNGLIPGSPLTPSVHTTHQYLYRTTDSLGDPVAAVTTLLVPNDADPTKLLAYQNAYDSANPNCSPSYGLRSGANTTAVADIIFIIAALNKGWYVITPDFEGLQAQFTAGVQSGYATLDSVRVALNSASDTGLSTSARYAMWGYSGGALASEWAAELAPSYAPELKFEGAALGGLTPNVKNVAMTINQGPFAGLSFSGISGLAKAYPNLTDYVNQHLIPSKRAKFESVANGCLGQAVVGGFGQDLYSFFDTGMDSLNDPVPASVLVAGGEMGTHGTPQMPLFAYKANGDEISPAADTDALIEKLCGQGSTIEYHKDLVGEHFTEAITGSASAFEWVADRLNGVPVTNQGRCVTQTVVLSSLDGMILPSISREVIAALQSLLGGPLGPQVSG